MGPGLSEEEVRELRRKISEAIELAKKYQEIVGRGNGGRELALVVTKLQEGKMWAGMVLGAIGVELPAQYADNVK